MVVVITIVNYGMGNLTSVKNAVEYLGYNAVISFEKKHIENADKFILPGVGAFGDAMERIRDTKLDEILHKEICVKKKPLLGICLGMQLICKESSEFGQHTGLGWIDAQVVPFSKNISLPVPHMGWNNIRFEKISPVADRDKEPDMYFVHSFHVICNDQSDILATCKYGIRFTAAVARENVFGMQFHPEKSQKAGLRILKRYLDL